MILYSSHVLEGGGKESLLVGVDPPQREGGGRMMRLERLRDLMQQSRPLERRVRPSLRNRKIRASIVGGIIAAMARLRSVAMRDVRDWIQETHSAGFRVAAGHFFLRFFDSDLVSSTPGQWQVVAGGVAGDSAIA